MSDISGKNEAKYIYLAYFLIFFSIILLLINNLIVKIFGGILLISGIVSRVYIGIKLLEVRQKQKRFLEDKRKIEEEKKLELMKHERELFEDTQRSKGLQKLIYRGVETWATPEQVREWKFIEVDLENNFQKLNPHQFEKAIADLFTKMKYDVARTPLTGDYGADLIVKTDNETIVVQCKKYGEKHKVGAPDVQRTLGSMYRYNASKSILITTSDFTNQAKIQASKAPIELWNKRRLREQFMKAYFELN